MHIVTMPVSTANLASTLLRANACGRSAPAEARFAHSVLRDARPEDARHGEFQELLAALAGGVSGMEPLRPPFPTYLLRHAAAQAG